MMSLSVWAIIVFAIISAVISNNAKMQKGRPRGRGNPWSEPWQPPAVPPRRVSTSQPRTISAANKPTVADPNKDRELAGAGGKEGEWGDEGRPSVYLGQVAPEGQAVPNGATEPVRGAQKGSAVEQGVSNLVFDEGNLIQGVVWAEILNRPRAMRPFRGPRS